MPDILKGHWPKAAIGGLVIVNAVLLTLLALDDRSRSLAAEPAPLVEPSATRLTPTPTHSSPSPAPTSQSPEPTTSSTVSLPSSTEEPRAKRAPEKRLLAVNSANLGWRAVVGHCPTDPQLEVSRDGGKTWRPTESGLRSISRLRSYDAASVFAVGGDEECEPRYAATGGPRERWAANPQFLNETWYRMPTEQHRIQAPGGRQSSPCGDQLGDFAGLGVSGAAAICGDGTVRLTQNRGRQWRDLEGATAGRAVGADEEVYVLAIRDRDCDGIGVVLLSPGAEEVESDAVHCAPLGGQPDTDLAVAVRGQVLWLWAGNEVAISTDRGRNWTRS